MREYAEFTASYAAHRARTPLVPLDFVAAPLSDNLFEWHFTLRGPQGSPYASGLYHGRILLPSNYPFRPPDVVMLTPSGRFEVHKKICLSISSFHPANWQPSWSIRTVLTALMAFFPTPAAGAIGSLEYTDAEKVALAAKSAAYTCAHCGATNAALMHRHERGAEYEEDEHGEGEEEDDDGEDAQRERGRGGAAAPEPVAVVEAAIAPTTPPSASRSGGGPPPPPPPPSAAARTAPTAVASTGASPAPASAGGGGVDSSSVGSAAVSAAPVSAPGPPSSASRAASFPAAAPSPAALPAAATVPAIAAAVASRPGKLSRATVALSLLIVGLLLRKLLAHLLQQQQQHHSITLFNAR